MSGQRPGRHPGIVQSSRFSPAVVMLAIVVGLDAVLVIVGFALQHYFGVDVLSSVTFDGADQGPLFDCVAAQSGLGDHCFGDYTVVADFVMFPDPWQEIINGFYSNYPAAGMLPFLVFAVIGSVLGDPRIGLGLYLVVMAAGISAPAIWASKGRPLVSRMAIACVLGVVSVPALMVLDRGNGIGLIAPVIWLLFLGLGRDRPRLVVWMIIVAALIKPQYAVLVLIPLLRGRWRDTLYSAAGAIVFNVLAFLMWPAHFPGTILTALRNVLQFGSTLPLSSRHPPNISFARGLESIEELVRGIIGAGGETIAERIQGLVGPAILVAVIVAVLVLRRRIPAIVSTMLIVVCASLLPSVSYTYYLVFALPFAAVILRHPGSAAGEFGRGLLDTARRVPATTAVANFAVAIATALTMTCVLLPGVQADAPVFVATDSDLIPIAWFVVVVLVVVAALRDPAWAADIEDDPGLLGRFARRGAAAEPRLAPVAVAGGRLSHRYESGRRSAE